MFLATVIIFSLLINKTFCFNKEITITVDPGKRDCFFQNAKSDDTIELEYQVIDGGLGDLDISFELIEENGRLIFADYKKSENVYRHIVKFTGDYQFCFDNRFSSFNSKTVFFEIIIDNELAPNKDEVKFDQFEGLTPEKFYDLKIQDIMDYISRIRTHISKARQLQDFLQSHEARDRNIAEENYLKVNLWSFFQLIAMLCVGALQVYMVKSIFDTSGGKMQTFWKKIGF